MRESAIESRVRQFAELNGCVFMKLAAPGQKGQPDRMVLRNNKTIFIEFKAPGKKPDPLQLEWQRRLRAQGFVCEWVDNAGEGITLVEEHLL